MRKISCVDSMATTARAPEAHCLPPQLEACGPRQCVKDTVPFFHESLKNTTHTVFQVQEPVSPSPECFSVNIFNGSNGVKVPVTVCSIDTIGKLQQEVLKQRPDFVGYGNLAYNGKTVELHNCKLYSCKSLYNLQ